MRHMSFIELGPFLDASGYDVARELDANDPLRGHRYEYVNTDPDLLYLDGNSLGRQPAAVVDVINTVTQHEWGDRLIRSWNDGWWELQVRLGDLLAPLVGAKSGEVIISDSTSVNLYKLALATLIQTRGHRDNIVTDDLNFPTDVYVLDGVAKATGGELVVVESDGIHGPLEALTNAIDNRTALVSLSHTVFKSGYTYDMKAMTALAHEAGAMILWDTSHSVGVVPIDLQGAGVDLAIGCTYKYLNGGPGSPAFLYVREGLQDRLENPIQGWWGHADPFAFDLAYRPVDGIRKFHTGTMPILSLAAIEPGLNDVRQAGITAIRAKSSALTSHLIDQHDEHLSSLGFTMASPRDPEHRGSHVSLTHEMAWPITRALIERANVIPDFRTPDNIRLGLSPLYTSFIDVHNAVQRIKRIVSRGIHEQFADASATVT